MSIPLRGRLLDERTGATLTDCTDVDGLFVDRVFPAEPLYERYTLVSCVPSGPLRAAIGSTGPAWFGNSASPARPSAAGRSATDASPDAPSATTP